MKIETNEFGTDIIMDCCEFLKCDALEYFRIYVKVRAKQENADIDVDFMAKGFYQHYLEHSEVHENCFNFALDILAYRIPILPKNRRARRKTA